jgi:pimeloyl-ACP methyl ester carboxylesterase
MGGYVALAFYRLFPRRVRALVLADTRPQADTPEARANRETMAERILGEGMHTVADAMLPKLLAPATHEERPQLVARVREMILATPPAGAVAALRGMAVRRDQTDLLPDILAPTLVLVGSEDFVTPPSQSERIRRGVRNADLVVFERCGHHPYAEQPEAFVAAVRDWLLRVR